MVEVFKTNVPEIKIAGKIIDNLLTFIPARRINFDLDDCDKILRIEGEAINTERVIQLVRKNGYDCEQLT